MSKSMAKSKTTATAAKPRAAKASPPSKARTKSAAKANAIAEQKPVKKGKAPVFANYHAALEWLHDRLDVERTRPGRIDPKVFKLDRMRHLMEALGNPQDSLRCVHVGGTNGKGSICAMVTQCLRECGYTVGMYTSPHLIDLRERIQINGSVISHHAFTDILGRVCAATKKLSPRLGVPTFFEVMTAVAFVQFAEEAVDAAVIEVGLGGKLDSTNIIIPEVAAVGSIGWDHMQLLGDTLDKIAEQKAGIFKKNVPAITFQQDKSVVETMRRVAEEVGAIYQVVGDDIEFSLRFEANPQLGPHMRVGLSSERVTFEHIPVPLPGEHQAHNCGLTLAILDKLIERGFELPESKIISGLESVHIPGRMELASKEPRIILDGAHNPPAMNALMKSIGAHVAYDSMIVIFGCAADKDLDDLLKKVSLGADKVIFTKARNNQRAADPKDLARRFNEVCQKMCQTTDTLEEALSVAVRAAGRDDLICITGSFYLVGEAKKMLAERDARVQAAAAALA
jgi:dihydrofolate synthase/folylpolyglutamate synthase